MTKKAYWTYFLKRNVPGSERIHIESPDYKLANYGIYTVNYKQIHGKYSYRIDSLYTNSQIKYIGKNDLDLKLNEWNEFEYNTGIKNDSLFQSVKMLL